MISRSQHGYNTFHIRCVRIQIGDLHVKRLQPYQRVFHWSHKRRSKNKHISRMSCSSEGAMRKLILSAWGRTTRERSIKYLVFFLLIRSFSSMNNPIKPWLSIQREQYNATWNDYSQWNKVNWHGNLHSYTNWSIERDINFLH